MSKSLYPFGWNFVHKQSRTDRQTYRHTQTDTQTNCSENITPPRLRGEEKKRWQSLVGVLQIYDNYDPCHIKAEDIEKYRILDFSSL